ncbi:cellulose binding domain-containing protein [Streptomyces acidiscabies]|uniref:Cellulose binding domain-containing protein n=1 Tax=Streptomyces acidiscabies TaxID=42234 RepID=A0AAP6EID5_9ACTN|nr:cellulose binding domain-containing protein [Streptomyces acidiscabies]MBP5942051.1 cellulose-binding protein [Streptomyces sp. LBUM 1476]MBZ3913529.1 cellulose binding domain-containing protein [Streptomyces acidiscabies]MDX2963366.1 cellulose binding domain-containing protein [Streptomyces acidiscabies]MDX3023100.1 cellulose binding domain-containing protein [Streptomyces acidiscabies]MDX3792756.1 cellulose binding domain-containing protein [Streptomyces acidiscabies]
MITTPRARRRLLRTAVFGVLLLVSSFLSGLSSPSASAAPAARVALADSLGNATHFDGLGAPYGGCGVPQANLESQNFVALNVWNTPGSYAGQPTPRPIPSGDAARMGLFANGHNCGRWVRVAIGDYCTGVNDGAAGQAFCRNGSWTSDQYNGATLDMLVADSCGDTNAWCRDDPYHLDLATQSLNAFQLGGRPVADMYPGRWNNRHVSWSFIPAPGYSGDIAIGFVQNAAPWWPTIDVTHLPNGIHGVEYYNGAAWVSATMVSDLGQQYAIGPNSSGGSNYTIRVRDVDDKLVQSGRTYTFALPGSCSSGCSQPYTGVSYTTGGSGALDVPTNLAVTATTATSVSLSWNASSGAAGYTVYRDGQSVGTTTGTSFTDSGLSAATSYTYTVKAYDSAGGTSAASVGVSVTTGGGGGSGCTATTRVASSWSGGFTGEVTVTNTSTSTSTGWRTGWNWPGNQKVTSAWNTKLTQSGSSVTGANADYNGTIPPGGRTTFGFNATGDASGLPSSAVCTLN